MVSEITVDRSPESGGTKITLPDDIYQHFAIA